MTEHETYVAANLLKNLIFQRTHIPSDKLDCPRAKSEMTPCVARDGHLTVAGPPWVCVGCGMSITVLLNKELQRHTKEDTEYGLG